MCAVTFMKMPSLLYSGYKGIFPVGKVVGAPPSSAEVKNGGAVPTRFFMTWYLIKLKHRDNSVFSTRAVIFSSMMYINV